MNNHSLSHPHRLRPLHSHPALPRLGMGLVALLMASATSADTLEVRSDLREPAFAQVMDRVYQNRPYEALTTFLSYRSLEFNATGTSSVLLSDLYTRYGLIREADASLSRATHSDVRSINRNTSWISFGKLLYQTHQDSIALNFLRKPPALLSPLQESERVIMIANILIRQERVDEAIETLEQFHTISPFYRRLARYNLGLALLQPARDAQNQPLSEAAMKQRELRAIGILKQSLSDQLLDSLQTSEKGSWFGASQLFKRNPKKTVAQAAAPLQDVEDTSISDDDLLNLQDKIGLSLAYLYLRNEQPEQARQILRNVRLESPYSNQALLTSSHIWLQLRNPVLAYNFATELSGRDPADPMVQEGWLLAARALEDQGKSESLTRYEQAITLYKRQLIELEQLRERLKDPQLMRLFPASSEDPILLKPPVPPATPQRSIWAQLLAEGDIQAIIQSLVQVSLLEQQMGLYERQIAKLKSATLQSDAQSDLNEATRLATKIQDAFDKAHVQDQKVLVERILQVLERREHKLNGYLTEALLGLQRQQAARRKES